MRIHSFLILSFLTSFYIDCICQVRSFQNDCIRTGIEDPVKSNLIYRKTKLPFEKKKKAKDTVNEVPIQSKKVKKKMETVTFTTTSSQYRCYLRKGFEIKEGHGCYPTCDNIKVLANTLGLTIKTQYNPKLVFKEGDIAFFSRDTISFDELIIRFAERRIALDALEMQKMTLALKKDSMEWQGYFSSVIGDIIDRNILQKEYFEMKTDYQKCLENEPSMCIQINKKKNRVSMVINKKRIIAAKEKITNPPVNLNSTLTSNDVKTLANYYNLINRHDCNILIKANDGTIASLHRKFAKQGHTLNLLLASREVLLEASNKDNPRCFVFNNEGDLDYAAVTFIIPQLKD